MTVELVVREARGNNGGQLLLWKGRGVAVGSKALDSFFHCYCNVHGPRKVRVLLREAWQRQSNGAYSQIMMFFLADYLVDNWVISALAGATWLKSWRSFLSLLHVGDILQASDNLSRVINSYKKIIEGQVINGEVDLPVMSVVEGEFLGSQLGSFWILQF